jgi:ubiquinone/menaquinone biosynthesis C-methylase UbiE
MNVKARPPCVKMRAMTAETPEEVVDFYSRSSERLRLQQGRARLELVRVQEILGRRLPPPPSVVVDVGGGAGVHATWLARRGYEVHLVDPVPLHVEQALEASAAQPDTPLASVSLADARTLSFADQSVDAALLLGPLYHLPERADRIAALTEARRVLRPGGTLVAIAISRYAWLLDGLATGRAFTRPDALARAAQGIATGLMANPERAPRRFTTAYLHHQADLEAEVRESGFEVDALLGVEGPGWLLQAFDAAWSDAARRETLLEIARLVEEERELIAASTHMLAVARRV